MSIHDEEALNKENLNINISTKEFDDNMQKLTDLKNVIQNEMEKIDKRYVNVDNETTQFYKEKRDKLNK